MQNIFIELLPPWIETGLQPAFYDKESGTVLQQVARMWAKVIELGQGFNTFSTNVTGTVNSYITQFTELHDYVHDYFDNLDVQEEINNKLDDMVEDGTMEELLSHMYKFNYNYINLNDYFGESISFTSAITSALTECASLNKNLVIPKGNYELTSAISIGTTRIDGNGSVITYNGDDANYLISGTSICLKNISFDLNGKAYSLLQNSHVLSIEIENVDISNGITNVNAGNYSQNYGLYLDATSVKIRNVNVHDNDGHGIGINPTVAHSAYYIDNCQMSDNGTGSNISLGLVNTTRANGANYDILSVTNCFAEGNTYSGIATHQANNAHIIGCNASGNGEHGITLMDCKNATVTNCTCLNNVGAGIRVQGDLQFNDSLTGVSNSVIANNIIIGTYGITISQKCHDITITDNVIETSNYTVYISQGSSEVKSYNIDIRNNILNSNETHTKGDIAVNGDIANLTLLNKVNGKESTYAKGFSNGRIFNYATIEYGNRTNLITDPYSPLTSSSWTKLGTVDGSLINASSTGYYLAQIVNLTKKSDYVSVMIKFDTDYSNEENLGITVECREGTTNRGSYAFRYPNIDGYVALTFKISDCVSNPSVIDHLRLVIMGTTGKHIKPVYALMNNSDKLPYVEM